MAAAVPILPATGIPYVVCGIMIDHVVADGSQAMFKTLAMIGLLGVLGGPTMRNMNAAWTLARVNRAKARYAPGHTANQAASAAAGPPPGTVVAPAVPAVGIVTPVILSEDIVSFRYLCYTGIITPDGFNPFVWSTPTKGGPSKLSSPCPTPHPTTRVRRSSRRRSKSSSSRRTPKTRLKPSKPAWTT